MSKARCPFPTVQSSCSGPVELGDSYCYYHKKLVTGLTTPHETISSYDDLMEYEDEHDAIQNFFKGQVGKP